MKVTCLSLALCALLLQGCESARPPHIPISAANALSIHAIQSPEEVVASLNRLYDDQNNDCREIGSNLPRGHYYCSGLLIRATQDGDYLPWTFSPGAIAQGGAAFSWIRKDMHPAMMLNPSGFILRNAREGERYGLPGFDAGLICLYPFDASTSGNLRHNGCGRLNEKPVTQAIYPQPDVPHRNAGHAWGSCEEIGITTIADWIEYTGDLQAGDTHNQCSWNVDSQIGWNNALAIAPQYPSMDFIWNELIMATVDDGYSLKDYIPAVFLYAPSLEAGLEPARNFQRKLAAHGNVVPIVRLDYQAQPPFSYHAQDQIIALP